MASIHTILKIITGFCIIVILSAGLATTGLSIWVMINHALASHLYLYLAIPTAAGLVVALGSILWLIGAIKKNKCLFIGFFILVVIIFGGVLFFAAALDKAFIDVFQPQCEDNDSQISQSIQNRYNEANSRFCNTEQCGLKNDTILQGDYTPSQKSYLLNNVKRNDLAAIKYQDYQDIKKNGNDYDAYQFIGAIQKDFLCTNWCQKVSADNLYYKFWDVNQGRPLRTCYKILRSSVLYYAGAAKGFLIGFASVLAVAVLLSIILPILRDPVEHKQTLLTNNDLIQTQND